MTVARATRFRVAASFDEEYEAKRRRRAAMRPRERLTELAALQDRRRSRAWRSEPMIKRATSRDGSWEKSLIFLTDDMRRLVGLFRDLADLADEEDLDRVPGFKAKMQKCRPWHLSASFGTFPGCVSPPSRLPRSKGGDHQSGYIGQQGDDRDRWCRRLRPAVPVEPDRLHTPSCG